MEELQNEAVNTGVEESQDVSDSPSDEQELTREERLERENQLLKQNLREQSKKRRALSEEDGDEDEGTSDLAAELSEIKQQLAALNEGKAKKASEYRESVLDRLYDTEWGRKYAPETPGSEREFAKLQKTFKALSQVETIDSPDDYFNVMRKADAVVSGRPDALLDMGKAKESEKIQEVSRRAATGPGGSSVKKETPRNALSAEENKLLDAFGVSPEERAELN